MRIEWPGICLRGAPNGMVATPTETFGATTSKSWNHKGFVASLPRVT
jgi:hypothetical protein